MTWEQTKREYRDDHPWCQIWPILTDPIREVVIGYSHARNIDGHEIAHICRGSGRRDVVETSCMPTRMCIGGATPLDWLAK